MPSEHGRLHELVRQHMVHSEGRLKVGRDGTVSRCNIGGNCYWDFPHPPALTPSLTPNNVLITSVGTIMPG